LSLLVIGSWIFGAVALQDFAVALLVGLITGSYSSIFIATPILAMLKSREPKWRAVRHRAMTRDLAGPRQAATAPAMATVAAGATATGDGQPEARAPASAASRPATAASRSSGLTHPPRPRKKKRR